MGRNYVAVGVLIGLVLATSALAQQNPDVQKAALKEIRDTAANICYTVEQKGFKSDAQLSGEVQAKVNGAIAKLADIGVKGSGQIGSMEYQGVSQEALGTALMASVNCRERVFDKLVDRMLPAAPSGEAPPHQTTHSDTSGNNFRQRIQTNEEAKGPVQNRFFGNYSGSAENITQRRKGILSIIIEQGMDPGEISIFVQASGGLLGKGEGTGSVSSDGNLSGKALIRIGNIEYDMGISGKIRENILNGTYDLYPRRGAAQMPSQGRYNLQKFPG